MLRKRRHSNEGMMMKQSQQKSSLKLPAFQDYPHKLKLGSFVFPLIWDTPDIRDWEKAKRGDIILRASPAQRGYVPSAHIRELVRDMIDHYNDGLAALFTFEGDLVLNLSDSLRFVHHGTRALESKGCLLVDGRCIQVPDSVASYVYTIRYEMYREGFRAYAVARYLTNIMLMMAYVEEKYVNKTWKQNDLFII